MAGTPILMADGTLKPIEQLKAGDEVLSKNEKTGEVAAKRVLRTTVRHNIAVLNLRFGNETIGTTSEHPFYAEGKGFVKAGALGVGTSIVTRAGPSLSLDAATTTNRATVYNCTVEGFHTYFIGNSALWVHNADYCSLSDLLDTVARQNLTAAEKKALIDEGLAGLEIDVFEWTEVPGVDGYVAYGLPMPPTFERATLYIAQDGTMWEGLESAIENGVVDFTKLTPRPFH